jgi:pilus assembly protein TadC
MNTQEDKDELPDFLEDYAREVQESGILVNDAVKKIIESIRNGTAVSSQDKEEVQQEIESLQTNLDVLKNEFNKVS